MDRSIERSTDEIVSRARDLIFAPREPRLLSSILSDTLFFPFSLPGTRKRRRFLLFLNERNRVSSTQGGYVDVTRFPSRSKGVIFFEKFDRLVYNNNSIEVSKWEGR